MCGTLSSPGICPMRLSYEVIFLPQPSKLNSTVHIHETIFPGLWLVGVTANAYKVADSPSKRWICFVPKRLGLC
ncbi:hypothetical protein L3X38_018017 [Prunus dulcis]|uniref:Uncharacterized protein n=1 Tax=Prunus dulcis TaxID=3755 RepID=A0AAD4W880_PRUDU|nr:hypothetical protein L3X38_018017 [Prunus dulcis]